jgi:hypothetical protein
MDTIHIPLLNIDVRFDYTPQTHPSEPQEYIEILEVWVGTYKLGIGSAWALLHDVYIYYDPHIANEEATEYCVRDIIEFHIWDYINECKADKEVI